MGGTAQGGTGAAWDVVRGAARDGGGAGGAVVRGTAEGGGGAGGAVVRGTAGGGGGAGGAAARGTARGGRRAARAAAGLVLAAALLAACGGQPAGGGAGGATPGREPVPVQVAEATRGRLDRAAELNGRVRGHAEVAVRPQLAGVIDAVRVEVGQRVKAGDVLVELEAASAEAQVQQAQAALDAARAGLAQAERAARGQALQADAELEQARLAEQAARAQLEGAREALSGLEGQWQALGCGTGASRRGNPGGTRGGAAPGAGRGPAGAGAGGPISPGAGGTGDPCAELAASLAQARAALRQAELGLEGARVRVEAATRARDLARSGDPLAAARAQVRQAEAALAAARRQQELARIIAPISGVVAAVRARPGELASPQSPEPLVVLVQPDPARVEADLPEGLYDAVTTGAAVDVLVGDRTLRGRVIARTLVPDPRTGIYTLTVEVPDSRGALVPGQAARVRVPVPAGAEGVLIPVEALQEADEPGRGVVFVVRDGRAVRREVRYAAMTSSRVAVIDGLEPGEQVIVRGHEGLADGDPVRVVPGPAPAAQGRAGAERTG